MVSATISVSHMMPSATRNAAKYLEAMSPRKITRRGTIAVVHAVVRPISISVIDRLRCRCRVLRSIGKTTPSATRNNFRDSSCRTHDHQGIRRDAGCCAPSSGGVVRLLLNCDRPLGQPKCKSDSRPPITKPIPAAPELTQNVAYQFAGQQHLPARHRRRVSRGRQTRAVSTHPRNMRPARPQVSPAARSTAPRIGPPLGNRRREAAGRLCF